MGMRSGNIDSPAGRAAVGRTCGKPAGRLIAIGKRNLTMMKKDLLLRNPLHLLGLTSDDSLPDGAFGAVLARAGIGKTAFLIQIALHTMLRDRNVLHISLEDPVDKVNLWYREVFQLLAKERRVQAPPRLWDDLLPHRFIMTFKVEGFSAPKLQERMTDLMEQGIFRPHTLIVDGMPFEKDARGQVEALKQLSADLGVRSWFTVRTHRHEPPLPDGLPPQLGPVQDLFEVAVQLLPQDKDIHIHILKGLAGAMRETPVRFDPATMLIKDAE
jgi:hypothetical protein